jgi:hypothetical protein
MQRIIARYKIKPEKAQKHKRLTVKESATGFF